VRNREAAGGLVVFLFGAATVYLSQKMDIGSFRAAGPGLFPLCLGILLLVLSSGFILKNLFAGAGGRHEQTGPEAEGSVKQVALFLGAIGLAILLLQPFGYPLTSFLLLLSLLRILGVKAWRWNGLVSFAAALISYLLFVQWLMIPLPRGWFGL
jgi:putative tricarboxylic transport membrane protein